ncbi:TAXI family TRAP transporter solute-binding subunit [Paracoccus saliphilus]|uniref:TAXI family TRAP transporter solute-binding subunit n=1 Tax=Paracoccus saliphilus TaxID=405559 RepID=A0AA45W5N1_9RHOB|nr:TAXI family TRAP transporter solute-binding subunit [Paracoccus saliphilus]WCR05563.1 TAXI family TRAP transporter solute-binding subunit [Paracoccus saliphilus]SIS95654.1 TRAP transporter solute receptor, TAXI family [Paracoccus saliphilus]
MKRRNLIAAAMALMSCAGLALPAMAQTQLTFKSAKTGTSYYQMGVELAEAVKSASQEALIMTVEESQGSVQNVMEVRARGGDYIFTSPPSLIASAKEGAGPFEGKADPKFSDIRALFPIPSLTMHFVVTGSEGPTDMSVLEGTRILLGKGTFSATEGERYLELFGLKNNVTVADAELSNAGDALKNGQIDAFVSASSWPAPNIIEAAASTGVRILSLSEAQVEETGQARVEIPAETYPGQAEPIVTTGLPVVAFTTTAMDEQTAYDLTKHFWETREKLAETAAWWAGVSPEQVAGIGELHPGAARYYEEAGVDTGE